MLSSFGSVIKAIHRMADCKHLLQQKELKTSKQNTFFAAQE